VGIRIAASAFGLLAMTVFMSLRGRRPWQSRGQGVTARSETTKQSRRQHRDCHVGLRPPRNDRLHVTAKPHAVAVSPWASGRKGKEITGGRSARPTAFPPMARTLLRGADTLVREGKRSSQLGIRRISRPVAATASTCASEGDWGQGKVSNKDSENIGHQPAMAPDRVLADPVRQALCWFGHRCPTR